jgi:hypothetical protein
MNANAEIQAATDLALRIKALALAAEQMALYPKSNPADTEEIVLGLASSISCFADGLLDKLGTIEKTLAA